MKIQRSGDGMTLWEREQKFIKILIAMESRGIKLDGQMCSHYIREGNRIMMEIIEKLAEKGYTYSLNSSKDKERLFRRAGIPILQDHLTRTGRPSFDKNAMEAYHEILQAEGGQWGDLARNISNYMGWSKAVSSYYEPYVRLMSPKDGRLRPNYRATGTVTGRLSCAEPNLQQIPRSGEKPWNGRMKEMFVCDEGFRLLNVDYSQLEFRLAAFYAQEPGLVEIFERSRGHTQEEIDADKDYFDIFNNMSRVLGRDRNACKTLTYAKLYGASPVKIGLLLGEVIPEELRRAYEKRGSRSNKDKLLFNQAKEYMAQTPSGIFFREWEETYPKIVRLANWVNRYASQHGYITYWSGRRRHLVDDYGRRFAYKAFNSLIQGGGAEMVKSAMIRIMDKVDSEEECRMILQVHDSLLFEVREDKLEEYKLRIKEVMEDTSADFPTNTMYFASRWEYWGQHD